MARKRGVTRDETEVFLAEISRHGSVRKACRVAGVSRSWLRERKKRDDEFMQNLLDAFEDSTDRLEESGYNRALMGEEKLIRYLLDAKRYKKNTEVELGDITPTINITIGG